MVLFDGSQASIKCSFADCLNTNAPFSPHFRHASQHCPTFIENTVLGAVPPRYICNLKSTPQIVTNFRNPPLHRKPITWQVCRNLSLAILPALIVLNFYGLYSNNFYWLKVDNYIFPLITILHFAYLHALHHKIREGELVDQQLRNLEYGMFGVLFIYAFKLLDTLYVLMSYNDYDHQIIPKTFLPVGLAILCLHGLLIALTFAAFHYRKTLVGSYIFDRLHENIDSWR